MKLTFGNIRKINQIKYFREIKSYFNNMLGCAHLYIFGSDHKKYIPTALIFW